MLKVVVEVRVQKVVEVQKEHHTVRLVVEALAAKVLHLAGEAAVLIDHNLGIRHNHYIRYIRYRNMCQVEVHMK